MRFGWLGEVVKIEGGQKWVKFMWMKVRKSQLGLIS